MNTYYVTLDSSPNRPSAAAVVHLSRRPYESAPRDCQPFYPFVSRCMCVRACDNHVQCVLVSCGATLAAMVACVEEVCKIWIWLFRNVRGEGFEGSSVVRMAQEKISAFAAFLPPGSGKGTPESGDGQPE